MAKPKNLEQLRAEKEQVETQLAQEQHKLERLENRKKYLEKGERTKRTHAPCSHRRLHFVRKIDGRRAGDRKSTRLNSSHWNKSRMPSSA